TLEIKNVTVEEAIRQALKDQPLEYYIENRTVVISKKKEVIGGEGKSWAISSLSIDVKGRVVNDNGDPVLASVTVKGTGVGTNTNENGEFRLQSVDASATLIITGIGIELKEIKLNGPKELLIVVKIAVLPLEETVIKGYYTSTR